MPDKIRRVFFSLHYQRDIFRAQQVKQHWVTKDTRRASGFFDGSLEEKAKKDGSTAVKRMINQGLEGASVTCVLIGAETYTRRWVDYEIFKSIEVGMGIFGVRIHNLKNQLRETDPAGSNPFHFLGYGIREGSEMMWPMIKYSTGWRDAPENGPIRESSAPYLVRKQQPILESLFNVYDWVADDGYENFSTWVADAAEQADR